MTKVKRGRKRKNALIREHRRQNDPSFWQYAPEPVAPTVAEHDAMAATVEVGTDLLEALTVRELIDEAKALEIPGVTTKWRKRQLIDAIVQARLATV